MRRSSSRTPSVRSNSQSPPPGRTLPRSRGPSKSPPATGTMLRVPCGTLPSFCSGAATILTVIRGREFMAASLPLGIGKCSLAPASRAQIIDTLERSKQSQFIIATHSPILMAYPDATIYSLDGSGISTVAYEETEPFHCAAGAWHGRGLVAAAAIRAAARRVMALALTRAALPAYGAKCVCALRPHPARAVCLSRDLHGIAVARATALIAASESWMESFRGAAACSLAGTPGPTSGQAGGSAQPPNTPIQIVRPLASLARSFLSPRLRRPRPGEPRQPGGQGVAHATRPR